MCKRRAGDNKHCKGVRVCVKKTKGTKKPLQTTATIFPQQYTGLRVRKLHLRWLKMFPFHHRIPTNYQHYGTISHIWSRLAATTTKYQHRAGRTSKLTHLLSTMFHSHFRPPWPGDILEYVCVWDSKRNSKSERVRETGRSSRSVY